MGIRRLSLFSSSPPAPSSPALLPASIHPLNHSTIFRPAPFCSATTTSSPLLHCALLPPDRVPRVRRSLPAVEPCAYRVSNPLPEARAQLSAPPPQFEHPVQLRRLPIAMSSVRLTSALARRSLTSPLLPCAAPPASSALRSFSSASYSVCSSSSSSSSPSTARALASSARVSLPAPTATRSLYRIQSRTMATEGAKIRVTNPVVELDGDEVGLSRA